MAVNKAENPETARLSRDFGWLAALGVILVLAGLVGLVYTGVATLTSTILFGWLLLIGDGGTARSSEVESGGRRTAARGPGPGLQLLLARCRGRRPEHRGRRRRHRAPGGGGRGSDHVRRAALPDRRCVPAGRQPGGARTAVRLDPRAGRLRSAARHPRAGLLAEQQQVRDRPLLLARPALRRPRPHGHRLRWPQDRRNGHRAARSGRRTDTPRIVPRGIGQGHSISADFCSDI